MGFGTQHQTSGKLLQHFIPTMSMRLVLYSEAMQYCHQKHCLTWKFITQGLILGIKQKGKVRQALCCILIYQGLHTHTHTYISIGISAVWERSGGFLQSCWFILVWNGEQTFALRGFNSSAHLLPPTPAAIGAAMIGKFIKFLLIAHGIWTESGEEKTSEPQGCRIALPVITRFKS